MIQGGGDMRGGAGMGGGGGEGGRGEDSSVCVCVWDGVGMGCRRGSWKGWMRWCCSL